MARYLSDQDIIFDYRMLASLLNVHEYRYSSALNIQQYQVSFRER